MTGNITQPGQKDLHTFGGTAGEAVVVTAVATSGLLSAFAELLNPSGTVIAGNAGNGSTGSIVLPSTGTYTIRVSDFLPGTRTGGYELNLQFTKGGGCAATISCGQIASGNLTGISQHDAYSFNATAGEAVIVTSIKTSGTLRAYAQLFGPTGSPVAGNAGDGNTGSIALPATGVYTILVSDFIPLGGTGGYELNLQFTTGRCAQSITCGQTVSGNLTGISQHNTYSFRGSAGEKVVLTANKTSGTLSAFAYLYGPTGSPLGGNAGDGSSGSITLPSAGVYTIDVSDFIPLGGTGAYNLRLSCEGAPCSYAIDPRARSFSAAGGSGSVSVTTEAGCSWTSASNANWITISSGGSGSGNGIVNYSVSGNTAATPRTGALTIAGLTLTVTQDGTGAVTTVIFPTLANTAGTPDPEDAMYTGIAMANLGSTRASLTFTAFNTSGALISGNGITNPKSIDLDAGAQLPTLDYQIFGAGFTAAPRSGWLKVDSTSNQIAAFFLTFNEPLSMLDGSDVSSTAVTSSILPEIESHGFTRIHVANPNPEPITVSIALIGADGIVKATAAIRDIAAWGSVAELLSDLFPAVVPVGSNYIRVSSSKAVAAMELLGKTRQYIEALNGQDATAGAGVLYSPQYAVGGSSWRTTLSVVNLDPTPGNVTFRFFSDDGSPIGATRSLPIASRGKIFISDQDFFLAPGGSIRQGYVEVNGAGLKLAGSVVFGDPDRATYSSSLPLVADFPSSFVFSQVASDDTYYTGIALLNPGNADVTATIQVIDKNGSTVASKSERIGAKQRKSMLLTQYFPALTSLKISAGYIKISANGGLAGFALFGTQRALSAVPPQVVR